MMQGANDGVVGRLLDAAVAGADFLLDGIEVGRIQADWRRRGRPCCNYADDDVAAAEIVSLAKAQAVQHVERIPA